MIAEYQNALLMMVVIPFVLVYIVLMVKFLNWLMEKIL
jgi:hypothetical protein